MVPGSITRLIANIAANAAAMPSAQARFYLVACAGYPAGALVHGVWAVLFWHLDLPVLALWDIGATLLWALCSWLHVTRRADRATFLAVILSEVPARAILATYYTGYASSFWLFIAIGMMAAVLAPFFALRIRAAIVGLMALLLTATAALPLVLPPPITLAQSWILFFLVTNVLTVASMIVLMLVIFQRAVDHAETRLAEEYQRAENLLRNILPDPIAARLKDGERVIADEHGAVSVIFADIVDFTAASARLTPTELVETLNLVFTEFDRIADANGAEKIKTIGDAYMVVVGVPEGRANHAQVAVDIALQMHRAVRALRGRTHFPVELRIGVNSGPVVAGVIGQRKFAYDLWGDAVNVASRMESHGDPGKVMITEGTRDLLGDGVALTDEGTREIKGKGPTRLWSVRPAPAPQAGA